MLLTRSHLCSGTWLASGTTATNLSFSCQCLRQLLNNCRRCKATIWFQGGCIAKRCKEQLGRRNIFSLMDYKVLTLQNPSIWCFFKDCSDVTSSIQGLDSWDEARFRTLMDGLLNRSYGRVRDVVSFLGHHGSDPSSTSHLSKAVHRVDVFFLRCLLHCGTPTSAGFLEDWTTGWHRDLKKSDHTTFKKKSGKVMVMSLVVKWFQLQLGLFTFYLVLFNT